MESLAALSNRSRTDHHTGQCAPMPPPPQGSFTLVAGNGTSVGTVMTLVCSHRHRPISGGLISCVQESNGTQWRGGNPECKPFSETEGYRLAILLSIVSTGIILLMSIYFITSCLLERVKKEEMRQERERKRENERLWNELNAEEQRESFYNHNGRISNINNNNNNNNHHHNNSNSSRSRVEQHPRCHQKNYPDPQAIHPLQPNLRQMSATCPLYNQIH